MMKEFKSEMNQKTTLMDYLTKTVFENYKELSDFHDNLKNISEASEISLVDVNEKMKKLEINFKKIEETTQQYAQLKNSFPLMNKNKNDENLIDKYENKYFSFLSNFVSSQKQKFESIFSRCQKMNESYKKTLKHFGSDPLKTTNQEFFSLINAFVNDFKSSYNLLCSPSLDNSSPSKKNSFRFEKNNNSSPKVIPNKNSPSKKHPIKIPILLKNK